MARYNPMTVAALSWMARVEQEADFGYDVKADDRNTDGSYVDEPGDSAKSVVLSLSIGDGGRGSAVLKLTGDSIPDVVDVLDSWDPEVVNPENLTPAQIVQRTLRAEYADLPKDAPEGTKPEIAFVCFRPSLAKHTREIKVPFGEFESFKTFLANAGASSTLAQTVTYWRSVVAENEKAEAVKAAKAAKLAAAAEAAKASGK